MASKKPQHELRQMPIDQLVVLRRNPQYMSPHGMEALKASIQRDGFLSPILVRPQATGRYEIVSGNHRVMAARELGMKEVPAVVSPLDDAAAGRVAVNMNTVHGDPTAELLAPFLAELDDDTLTTVHLPAQLLHEVCELDAQLAETLSRLETPAAWDTESPGNTPDCVCPACGRRHIRASDKTHDE